MDKNNIIAKKSLIIAIIMILSSILGLLRETIIASQFGAGIESDAYFVAQTIPSLVTNVVNAGVISSFVTVYTSYLIKGEKEKAKNTTNCLITMFGVGLTIVVVILFIKSEYFISLLANSYEGEILYVSSNLLKVMSISVLFSGIIAILVGINNANNSFIAPASLGLIMNIIMIIGTLSLTKKFGIYALGISMVIGIICQLAMQIPSAVKQGLRFRPNFNLRDEGVREILIMIFPFLFTAVINQINLIIDRNLATALDEGMITSMYFAGKLLALPQNILSSALGMVILPFLVQHIAKNEGDKAVSIIIKGIRFISLIVFPIIVILNLFSINIVTIVFGHGNFTVKNIINTSSLIPFYFGVVYFGAIWAVLTKMYFAKKRTNMIVITSLISVVSKVIFSYILFPIMKAKGLVLADSIAAFIAVLFMIIQIKYVLKIDCIFKNIREMIVEFMPKVLISTVSIYLVGNSTMKIYLSTSADLLISFLLVGIASTILILIYISILYILKVDEVKYMINSIIIKINKAIKYRSSYEK